MILNPSKDGLVYQYNTIHMQSIHYNGEDDGDGDEGGACEDAGGGAVGVTTNNQQPTT